MDFAGYEALTGESIAALAKRLKLVRGHLHKIASGERGWTSATALLIKRGTANRITPNDLMAIRERWLRRQAREKAAEKGRV